ncbi:MAG: HEAT repeat domain-containing protein [Planctomycetota bacterium]
MTIRKMCLALSAPAIALCFSCQQTEGSGENRVNGAGSSPPSHDPATDSDISLRIWIQRAPYLYVIGQPVNLRLRLSNHTKRAVEIRDCEQHYPFYSFEVVDPTGKTLEISKNLSRSMEKINPRSRTIGPGRISEVTIDLADWYDLSRIGKYTVKANWCAFAETTPYKRESNTIAISTMPPEQADIAALINRATLITANDMSERAAQLELVEMGDKVVPALLQWLEIEEFNGGLKGGWNSYGDLVRVLSQIGAKEARGFITQSSRFRSGRSAERLLRRIDIWQSDDRFDKLIAVLAETPVDNRKWAIFKLGVLGDKRAIGHLQKIAADDESMDIRETAKDILAHLSDPNVPLRYIDHRLSQRVELTPSANPYRIGEPVRLNCRLVAGEYGSQTLVEFSKPAWHFLPWGFSQPFILTVSRKTESRYDKSRHNYDRLLPVKGLHENKSWHVNANKEPLDGHINISELGDKSSCKLDPRESHHFVLEDISKAFKITEPGEYRIYTITSVGRSRVMSDEITINILPRE